MKIHKTQDYNLFKRIAGNRVLSKPHANRLREAIKDDPETINYMPIVINQNYEVIDGQHRLDAIRELGLPVSYVKVDNLNLGTVQRLNSISKTWTPIDYAKSFQEMGNENYRIYLEFKNKFKFNHDILMRYLSLDKLITSTLFKAGKLMVTNMARSYELCENLAELQQFYDRLHLRNQALGMLTIMQSKGYNHKHMLNKMRAHGHRIQEQKLQNDYAREFERIYNYHSQKEPIRLF